MPAKPKPHIVYPDAGDDARDILIGERLKRLTDAGDFDVHYGRPENNEQYLERIQNSAAILLGWDLPAEVMEQTSVLQVVSFTGIGVAKFVDLELAKTKGITVCNCPGYSDNTVAEHALALTLAAARQIPKLDKAMRDGEWAPSMGMELSGKQLGLIGFGGIAVRFAKMAKALGMKVVVWTRNPSDERAARHGVEFLPLEEVLATSDVVSVHLASNDATRGFVNRTCFEQLNAEAIFINTARGEVIDEQALIDTLAEGKIRGAGVDVFAEEPLPAGHPLTALDNVVLSPHVAYSTPEAEAALFDIGIDNIVKYFEDNPINVVTV
jgi:D-3-phosphoglycerate dehydrogenase